MTFDLLQKFTGWAENKIWQFTHLKKLQALSDEAVYGSSLDENNSYYRFYRIFFFIQEEIADVVWNFVKILILAVFQRPSHQTSWDYKLSSGLQVRIVLVTLPRCKRSQD